MSRQHFVTMTGQPPNGGVPPGVAFFAPQPQRIEEELGTVYPPPPPYAPPAHRQPIPPPPPPAPVSSMFVPPQPPPPGPGPGPAAAATPQLQAAVNYQNLPGSSLAGVEAPSIRGIGYLFAEKHTVLHFIPNRWLQMNCPGREPVYRPYIFPTNLTVGELIRQLGVPSAEYGHQYGITEVHEMGEGRFTAGQTILRDSEDANKTLAQIGWDECRGTSRRPVWIMPCSTA
ncbi:MAG: hypothetical protein Q9214_001428 [Letrouitia sp. 1 TL-2023]